MGRGERPAKAKVEAKSTVTRKSRNVDGPTQPPSQPAPCGGIGAARRDQRDPASDLRFAERRAAGARRSRRAGGPSVRSAPCAGVACRSRRRATHGRVFARWRSPGAHRSAAVEEVVHLRSRNTRPRNHSSRRRRSVARQRVPGRPKRTGARDSCRARRAADTRRQRIRCNLPLAPRARTVLARAGCAGADVCAAGGDCRR